MVVSVAEFSPSYILNLEAIAPLIRFIVVFMSAMWVLINSCG